MSKIKLIYGLGDLGKDAIHAVGGKAAHLGAMVQAGIPIPEGFVLSTSAFERFINHSPFRKEIRETLDKEIELTELIPTSQKLQKYIMETEFPSEMREPIVWRFNNLSSNTSYPLEVAVRSSANVEDLAKTSFAGQADTFLCISTEDDLIDSIKRCWASIYSARALMYIQQMVKVPLNLVSMGVVIQRMAKAEIAGVMFTANVLTKDRSQALINATWGFGETIADGQIVPDSITVDKDSLDIVKLRIGSKLKMSINNPKACGTILADTPLEKQQVLSLTTNQIQELVNYGTKIENFFNSIPQDVEWAIEEGRVLILQARAITSKLD